MKNCLFLLLIFLPLWHACGVRQTIPPDGANYTFCSNTYNFCMQYPRSVLPSPEEGDKDNELLLGLYSEEKDIRLFLSADKNAEGLTFEQMYEKQMAEWESTYDDVDEVGSNITDDGYDLSARADGYYLYSKSMDLNNTGSFVYLRLVGGPNLNELVFTELKDKILIYPNQ
jgi:hypothetical protein